MIEELTFPAGYRLFHRWQEGEPQASNRLKEIIEIIINAVLNQGSLKG